MIRVSIYIPPILALACLLNTTIVSAEMLLGVSAGNRVIQTIANGRIIREEQVRGADVREVDKESIAATMKLRENDLIRGVDSVEVGKRRIDEIAHLVWVMKNSNNLNALYYIREGKFYSVSLKTVMVEKTVDVVRLCPTAKPERQKVTISMKIPVVRGCEMSELDKFEPVEPHK